MRAGAGSIALCAVTLALTLGACDSTPGSGVPGTSSASVTSGPPGAATTTEVTLPPGGSKTVAAPSAASPDQVRRKTCEDLRPRFDKIRADSGQAAVDRAADEAIEGFPSSTEWAVLTDEQRQAVIAGAHQAASGKCQ
ncbi:hypothetical protein OHB26_34320 [Nocardia sp. NBC_01503]|uniref:hypothetical protein n=1 Tax=Nocardia sp. NBC_01503 TaxID=2975997 RepID=UPI002E7BBA83|nr:hypothetical protein [Nocardia sp. NBC_01503]WTL31919.1 hypothetical protein OHB26_34320 [Nocardia sp. NBC_01503]